jgi:hypothetical protein
MGSYDSLLDLSWCSVGSFIPGRLLQWALMTAWWFLVGVQLSLSPAMDQYYHGLWWQLPQLNFSTYQSPVSQTTQPMSTETAKNTANSCRARYFACIWGKTRGIFQECVEMCSRPQSSYTFSQIFPALRGIADPIFWEAALDKYLYLPPSI